MKKTVIVTAIAAAIWLAGGIAQAQVLFGDNFNTSAWSNNINFENALRQSGMVAPLTYNVRTDQVMTSLTGPFLPPLGALAIAPVNLGVDGLFAWASPNYNFIRPGQLVITYKVYVDINGSTDLRSILMWGSGYQGTMWGWSRCYWEGNGNDLMVFFPQGQFALEYQGGRIWGNFTPHEGYYDFKIHMNNSGSTTTVSIWLDGVKIIDNFQRGYGYTTNYISLGVYGYASYYQTVYYDDLSVIALPLPASQTINESKLAPDNTPVYVSGAIVCAAFTDSFYIEADDRSIGIRVEKAGHGLQMGMRADVTGTVKTTAQGERYIDATVAYNAGPGSVAPLVMTNRAIGGGDWRYDPDTRAGQKGITGASGLNNIGLLTRTTGNVIQPDPGDKSFFLDDGSGAGLKVVVESGGVPDENTYVAVTGVSSCRSSDSGATLQRLLRVGTSGDILILTDPASSGVAREVSLDGAWSYLPLLDGSATTPPPIDQSWQPITIPGMWGDDGAHNHAWFGRTFNVDASDIGKVFRINFGSVAFRTKVFLNGAQIGTHVGEWSPFELDATSAVTAGNNVLQLLVTNSKEPELWTAGEMEFGQLHYLYLGWYGATPDSYPRWQMGIPQSVTLKLLPRTYIDSVFVQPLVSENILKIDIELMNASDFARTVELSGEVLDGATPVLQLSPVTVAVPAHGGKTAVLSSNWTNGRLWWPDDPYLYSLSVQMKDGAGNIAQTRTERFGWREYKVDGINTSLNGRPFMLRGISYSTYKQTGDQIRDEFTWWRQLARANCFRLHMCPVPSSILDYCDETGLAILQQSTLTAGAPLVSHPDFWPNVKKAWDEYVKAHRNHPSVFIWGVGNEAAFTGGSNSMGASSVPHLIEMEQRTRALDPTRPVTEAHDWTLLGNSSFYDEMMGFAYEYYNLLPDYIREYRTYRIPVEDPVVRDMTRPLMHDEWLDYRGLHGAATLVGDLAYVVAENLDLRPIWMKYQDGYSGYMGMAEMRRLTGLAGAIVLGDQTSYYPVPDGLMANALEMKTFTHKNFQELIVVPVEWFAGHDADQPFVKQFIVMNDHSYALPVTLSWELKYRGGSTIHTGSMQLSMNAAEHRQVGITATLPAITGTAQTDLTVRLLDQPGGTELYSDILPYTLTKRPGFNTVPQFLLMGASQEIIDLLTSLGFNFVTSGSPPGNVIVVAPGASLSPSDWTSLESYVSDQGKSALICTTNLPATFCGVPLSVTTLKTNNVHINATDHAIFSGLQPHDVRFWAPDYRLATQCLMRPAYGSFTAFLDTGYSAHMWEPPTIEGKQGMNFTPMIEIRAGTGRAIVTQVPLFEKAGPEAVAALILRRTFDYMNTSASAPLPVINEGVTLPTGINLAATTWDNLSAANVSAVLLDGSSGNFATTFNAHSAALDTYVRAGGDLYIHNLTAANCAVVNAKWPLELAGTSNSAKRLLLLPTDTNTKNWMWYQETTIPWPLHILPQPTYNAILRGISHYQTCWYEDSGLDLALSQAPIIQTELTGNPSRVKTLTYPGALLVSSLQSGRIVFDQVIWDSSLPSTYLTARAKEYINQLLVNVGAKFN